jgi:hypothetical protein
MRLFYLPIIALLVIAIAGCNLAASPTTPTAMPTSAPTLAFTQPTETPPVIISPTPSPVSIQPTPLTTNQAVFDRASIVIIALKNKDLAALSGLVDTQLGLRFSPYAAVKDTDLVFTPDKLAGMFNNNTSFTWGAYDGTGEPIQLTFADYFTRFVYDVDFANAPQMALNHHLGVSTTLDNAAEYYPRANIVEFYFPGFDSAMQGMDWRNLRLVFTQVDGTWYLAGLIHDQWTT